MNKEAPSAGNSLSKTASLYETQRSYITWVATGWLPILKADVRRWFVRFEVPNPSGGLIYVQSDSDEYPPGLPTTTNVPLEFKWRDCPNMVPGEWYGFAASPAVLAIIETLYVGP